MLSHNIRGCNVWRKSYVRNCIFFWTAKLCALFCLLFVISLTYLLIINSILLRLAKSVLVENQNIHKNISANKSQLSLVNKSLRKATSQNRSSSAAVSKKRLFSLLPRKVLERIWQEIHSSWSHWVNAGIVWAEPKIFWANILSNMTTALTNSTARLKPSRR